MKIVINKCYGVFGLSDKAKQRLREMGYPIGPYGDINVYDLRRNNVLLVKVIEELGDLANGKYSKLKVVEIPDDVEWEIEEDNGIEWIAEKHRTWE